MLIFVPPSSLILSNLYTPPPHRPPTKIVLKILKTLVETEDRYYPERLNRYCIINSPRAFAWAWRIVRTFLDPCTRDKIHIVAGDPLPLLLK